MKLLASYGSWITEEPLPFFFISSIDSAPFPLLDTTLIARPDRPTPCPTTPVASSLRLNCSSDGQWELPIGMKLDSPRTFVAFSHLELTSAAGPLLFENPNPKTPIVLHGDFDLQLVSNGTVVVDYGSPFVINGADYSSFSSFSPAPGTLTFSPGSELIANLPSMPSSRRAPPLRVSGCVVFNGTLWLAPDTASSPSLPMRIPFIEYQCRQGTFDRVLSSDPCLGVTPEYSATTLIFNLNYQCLLVTSSSPPALRSFSLLIIYIIIALLFFLPQI